MKIAYVEQIPNSTDLYNLYECEQWNDFLQLSKDQLYEAMKNSWYILSAYQEDKLIATGRVVSDGCIVGFITGLIVHPNFRNRGIGKDILQKLISKCNQSHLTIQLLAADNTVSYYQKLGFQSFARGLIYLDQ